MDKAENEAAPLGWREYTDLPDFGIVGIRAKMDTGARSSALNAAQIRVKKSKNGEMVHFQFLIRKRIVDCSAQLLETRWIKDSGGHSENRPIIQTTLHLGGRDFPIELSLTERTGLRFPLLVGRTALSAGRFCVHAAKSFLWGKPLKARKKSKKETK